MKDGQDVVLGRCQTLALKRIENSVDFSRVRDPGVQIRGNVGVGFIAE